MTEQEIRSKLNPEGDSDTDFHIDAAIAHIQSKTNRDFEDDEGNLDFPFDLVLAVKKLIEGAEQPSNVASESVAGELSVSYFNADATTGARAYWLPYRKVGW